MEVFVFCLYVVGFPCRVTHGEEELKALKEEKEKLEARICRFRG